jgi:CubicO group peptidase (beta-lactamase class C family)
MARGAPTERLVDPLFLLYGVLTMAFGVGVWMSSPRTRAHVTGALLTAFAGIGLLGPTLFEMNVRGTSAPGADLPHIVLTAALGLFILAAVTVGAGLRGQRFRLYSLATLLVLVVFGVLTSFAARGLATGEPTPWVGLFERINIGAFLLWTVMLAASLWTVQDTTAAVESQVHGMVAPGFEEVRAEFERNFARRGEIGAAVAAYWRGEKVVDLWGGRRTPESDAPWNEDTMVVVNSTTKGLSAMTLAVANARGWLDYDAPVARYWPEFAENGKGAITVRQLLGHQAGLVLLDEPLTIERLRDLDDVARVLARQKPAWPPGTRHGYHTMTVGLYMQELIRRVDPAHRTLGRFFAEEIARPLGLDFHIGLPADVPAERLARLKTLTPWGGLLALRYTPPAVTLKMIAPGSLLRRSFVGVGADPNDRRYLEIEVPAGNGVGTARAIARAYSAFAEGGAEIGITPETFARVTGPLPAIPPKDVVLGVRSYFALGFLRPGPGASFGSSPRAFGAPGAGGSCAFADPDARLGYAYVMNRLDYHLVDDPREKPLRDAVYRAIARLRDRAYSHHAAA